MKNVLNYLLTKIIIQTKGHSWATDGENAQSGELYVLYVLEKFIFYFSNLKINSMEQYHLA